MFREMRRFKQQITTEECKKVLKEEKRAAFSVIGDDGYPYTIPINFYYDEADNIIYFHGAKEGHKADAVNRCDKVCLTVWNQGFKKEGHWEWNPTSVVVFGKVKPVTENNIFEDRLRKLAAKYYPTTDEIEEEMEHSASRTVVCHKNRTHDGQTRQRKITFRLQKGCLNIGTEQGIMM